MIGLTPSPMRKTKNNTAKGEKPMGMTDKQFDGFLRMQIGRIKDALEEKDPERKDEKLKQIVDDLQSTLES